MLFLYPEYKINETFIHIGYVDKKNKRIWMYCEDLEWKDLLEISKYFGTENINLNSEASGATEGTFVVDSWMVVDVSDVTKNLDVIHKFYEKNKRR